MKILMQNARPLLLAALAMLAVLDMVSGKRWRL